MRRYTSDGPIPISALYAWQLLGYSVYLRNVVGDRPIMLSRPKLNDEQNVSCAILLKKIVVMKSFL